jgi:hypothetical protein
MYRDGEWHQGGFVMYAVVRIYTGPGAKQFFDILEERKEDLEAAHQHVKGLMSYTLVRSGDGGVSITVCREKAGAQDSVRVAKEWLEKNAPGVSTNPPQLIEGAVIIHI